MQGDNKVCCRRVRLLRQVDGWNDRTLRLFAVWCAREALKLVKEPDPRSIAACDVAEKYANGQATKEELDAARDAARAAAWDAARDAAWDAAWAAARDAARDAQVEWIIEHMIRREGETAAIEDIDRLARAEGVEVKK